MRKLFSRSRIACALIGVTFFLAGGGVMVWRDYWTYVVLLENHQLRYETRSNARFFKEVVRPRLATDISPEKPEEITLIGLPRLEQRELLRRGLNRVCNEVRTAQSRVRTCTYRP